MPTKFSDKYLNNFDILKNSVVGFEWEFYTERPYYKLLELLNRELDPVKVYGYRKYHSSGEVDAHRWKIEPDLSGGYSMCELISGPLPYVDAKIYLLKVLKLLQEHATTDDKCSIHINVSFDQYKTEDILDYLNKLKVILNVDEEMIYKYFPSRRDNFYCKTVKKLIPFKNYSYSSNAIDSLIQNIELPDTKYYGINIANSYKGRLEFRYIGAKDYHFKTSEILELMDYFIVLTNSCINTELTDEDKDQLKDILDENINQFKNFLKLDSFIAEFPSVRLQVDKNDDIIILRSYYNSIYEKLFDLITNIYNLEDCVLNFDTETQKLEIVDANFKTIFDVFNINIVDSNAIEGYYEDCKFVNCDIKNAHLHRCKIESCDVFNCKVESCYVDELSIVTNCYVYNSTMDGKMVGGVFRSSKIGEFGELDNNVRIVTDEDNYFGGDKDVTFKDKMREIGGFKNMSSGDKKKFYTGQATGKKEGPQQGQGGFAF